MIKMLKAKKNLRQEAGVALLTTLLLLFLMSSMLVGFAVLLISNQQLAGSNNDQVHAFYGAEAGMEQMTAGLGNLFTQTYSPTAAQINTIQNNPPTVSGISYLTGDGKTGYTVTPQAVDSLGNPAPTISTIKSGPYVGMTAMATEYTLVVNARTVDGREVKLQRTTQTVGIPMFQFGIFSDTDLDFFPGPNFQFGGRTHTNGNLFLAAGSTLTLSDKVDAYKDVIRTNLENGWPTSSNYTGTVNVTTQPGSSNVRALATSEGSLVGTIGSAGNTNWPNISKVLYSGYLINGQGNPTDATLSTGAQKLNLGIVTIGNGATQAIDLMRRPFPGEGTNVTGERYFAQASLRVLVSDDPSDIMNLTPCLDSSTQPFDLSLMASDPGNLPGNPASKWLASPNAALQDLAKRLNNNKVVALPLAVSGALSGAGGAYNSQDGYWLPSGFPIIKSFIKIEEQVGYGSPCGKWVDVTTEVLSYGYVGRNIDPVPQSLDGVNLNPQWPGNTGQMDPLKGAYVKTTNPAGGYTVVSNTLASPAGLPGAVLYGYPVPNVPMNTNVPVGPLELGFQNSGVGSWNNGATLMSSLSSVNAPNSCLDPHPLAVIRLERIRDNPSSLYVGGYVNTGVWNKNTNKAFQAPVAAVCGVDPATGNLVTFAGNPWVPTLYDFWPNTLFDTREGTLRDSAMANGTNSTLPPPTLNGVMHYIELDGANVAAWFGGKIGTLTTSGQGTKDPAVAPNNFLVYISDRRGNYSLSQSIAGGWPPLSYTKKETGEYGWNDLVNFPVNSANGCPSNSLETGEDADGTSVLYTYGANEAWIHDAGDAPVLPATSLPLGKIGIFTNLTGGATPAIVNNNSCPTVPGYVTDAIWPMMVSSSTSAARENPALFFRRAVKIVNGSNLAAVGPCPGGNPCGLAIASENPVYIQGDYNANFGGIGFANSPNTIATSVAGDAVTLLSNNWNDVNSFSSPYAQTARSGITTWYRVAIIGGATPYFSNPSGIISQDYGTDGGVHNFLRYIENWGASSNNTLNYQGSIIDLFYSRQANATFKCCNTVYSPPARGYKFDTNFLTPALLPPRTPLFRDINTTGWTRLMLPSQ